jgi:drug/metabolite transporter (DMT)-like permease
MAIAGIASNLGFIAVKIIPFQKFIVIKRSESIITVTLGIVFFGEAANKVKLTAAALSFIGIVLVADPAIFGFEVQAPISSAEVMTTGGFLVALACACISSGNRIFIGENARKFEIMQNIMWSGFSGLVSGTMLNLFFGTSFMWPNPEHIPWILAGSLASACTGTLSLVALRYEKPSYIAVIANLRVVWVFAISILVEGELFNLENALGGCCVVLGTVMIVLKKPTRDQEGGLPVEEPTPFRGKLKPRSGRWPRRYSNRASPP